MNGSTPASTPAIEGAVNFRDAGGGPIPTGLLYRCGYLTDVTARGREQLRELGLRSVFDLREADEIAAMPSQWDTDVTVHCPRTQYAGGFDNGVMMLWGTQLSLDEARARRLETYRRMPAEFAASIGHVLRQIAKPQALPALVHCMGGKDRSGFVIALLQMLMGMPRDAIVAEYLRSAATADIDPKTITKLTRLYKLDTTGPGSSKAMMESVDAHLHAALDGIERDYGGIENYLLDACGLNHEEISALRAVLRTTI